MYLLWVQEGSTLQSALCAALSNTGCPWPAVIPVHDPLRDACWGAAVTCSGTTAFFDSDSIHISNLPEKLTHVRGLSEMLILSLQSSCCGTALEWSDSKASFDSEGIHTLTCQISSHMQGGTPAIASLTINANALPQQCHVLPLSCVAADP